MLVPLFGAAFGSAPGSRVRAIADNYSWPLVWTLGDGSDGGVPAASSIFLRPTYPGNQRWIDPVSATSRALNVTFPPNASVEYERLWAEVETARASGQPSKQRVNAWWARLAPTMVQVAPLSAFSCADQDRCIGVLVESGACVCA